MGISIEEAESLEAEFMNALDDYDDYSLTETKNVLLAWNHLYQLMKRENNLSCNLGSDILDWQIGNWANDTVVAVHNAKLYDDEIAVNEQILSIDWGTDSSLFYENAKRDIADTYADKGEIDKCMQLYEDYLTADPLWGWAWIGYFRHLKETQDERFKPVLDGLYNKIKSGTDFRDNEDLYRELADEYEDLDDNERCEYFKQSYDALKKSNVQIPIKSLIQPAIVEKSKKVYPNDSCPCGSGKKYKKCCGKNK